MKVRWSIFLYGVPAIALLGSPAEAKCQLQPYRIEVEVRSSRTREPVRGVQVAAFANSSESELLGGSVQSDNTTGPDGKLARSYTFDTYSGVGILHADRCDAKLRSLELVLIHPDYRVRRVEVKRVQISFNSVGDVGTIVVPPMLMDPRQP